MNKSSLLGDVINYLEQIQERVKMLKEEEEVQSTNQDLESVVLEKKAQPLTEDGDRSSHEFSGATSGQKLPEIEARLCDGSVVFKIRCEKQKGVIMKIITEIENMNLTVANTSVSPFGTLAHAITITAEMEKDFDMTLENIVNGLRLVLQMA
ncbi:hypothetical protein LguiA_033223 [Lonicera macranthoides]